MVLYVSCYLIRIFVLDRKRMQYILNLQTLHYWKYIYALIGVSCKLATYKAAWE